MLLKDISQTQMLRYLAGSQALLPPEAANFMLSVSWLLAVPHWVVVVAFLMMPVVGFPWGSVVVNSNCMRALPTMGLKMLRVRVVSGFKRLKSRFRTSNWDRMSES